MSGWYNGLDDVIASGYTHAPQVYVQISPSDVGFASERCGTWTRMPDGFTPPPPPPEPPLLIPLPWPLPPIDPVAAIAGIATNLPAVIGGALVGSVVLPILGPALAYGSLASGSVNPESVDSGSVNPESVASWEGSVMGG
ncbi:hypothetical protein P9209_00135 [Prescottella defluvii]|nr:hypothetical protein P9209_00135 [Prescottella defluvii]